jgi:hypothetical protein
MRQLINNGRFQNSISNPTGGRAGLEVPASIRQRLEQRLDLDLSSVRIHPDSDAAARLGCRAFACGSDVCFAPGYYRPETPAGLWLLGHELAHVAQQRQGRVRNPFGRGVAVVIDPDLEAEADAVGAWLGGVPLVAKRSIADRQAFRVAPPIALSESTSEPRILQMQEDIEDDSVELDEEDQFVDAYMTNFNHGAGKIKSGGQTARSVFGAMETIGSLGTSVVSTSANMLLGSSGGVVGTIAGYSGLAGTIVNAAPILQALAVSGAPILGPVGIGFMLLEMGMSGWSTAVTYNHIKKLNKITMDYSGRPGVLPSTHGAIQYAVKKKNKKLHRKGLGILPAVGSLVNTVYTIGRTIKKKRRGDKGEIRRFQAKTLWDNQLGGDPMAIAACQELLGKKVFKQVQMYADGFVLLKKKLRSL